MRVVETKGGGGSEYTLWLTGMVVMGVFVGV